MKRGLPWPTYGRKACGHNWLVCLRFSGMITVVTGIQGKAINVKDIVDESAL